ncbi:MAG: hypothetical protein IKF96_00890, partial [Eggerthellaceae bacterium]|nr:hypothetical protein [Eggerthellaceae bacterium]
GVITGRSVLRSATGELRIVTHPETDPIPGKLWYVPVSIEGENGEVECAKDEQLHIAVEGGELLAFASGNPREEEPFATPSCRTYYGRALAIIRPDTADVRIALGRM